jgi:lipopolysaccharide transport system ATP-binding protein
MAEAVVRLTDVSKRYLLRRGWYVTSIKSEVSRLTTRLLGRTPPPREEVWALRDVSFALERGEILGLIGLNGAGKSTLLKILSKVTVPSSGTFEVTGRLGALIEVGAGFHPELTGRENIFLNGTIMGMSRREVQGKFDQIVSFAEVERFIDTPIKFYSSGMQMRLGFSVAAHTDPDVLLVDEVLAVGDAAFQAKCLNKVAELKEEDKTIILVSHNLTTVAEQAKSVLWLDRGTVRMLGEAEPVVEAYLEHATELMASEEERSRGRDPLGSDRPVSILDVAIADALERPETRFNRGDALLVDITYSAVRPVPGAVFGVSVHDVQGYSLGGILTDPDAVKIPAPVERAVLRVTLDPLLFNRGAYTVDVHIHDPRIKRYYDIKRRAARFVVDGPRAGAKDSTGNVYYPHRCEQIR